MREMAQTDSRVERMMQLESLFMRDPDLLRDYLKDLRDRLDYENSFKWARTDGLTEGLAKGRAEGEAKGRAEGRMAGMEETAAAMLREKIDILLVSKVTGLSLDRLKALQARTEY